VSTKYCHGGCCLRVQIMDEEMGSNMMSGVLENGNTPS
jgi:hypothetical protein